MYIYSHLCESDIKKFILYFTTWSKYNTLWKVHEHKINASADLKRGGVGVRPPSRQYSISNLLNSKKFRNVLRTPPPPPYNKFQFWNRACNALLFFKILLNKCFFWFFFKYLFFNGIENANLSYTCIK